MITQKKVYTALADALKDAFGRPVYLDFCPQDFTRPCFVLEGMKWSRGTVNRHTVEEALSLTITCLGAVDSQGDSDQLELLTMLEELDALFRPGTFPVEGRAIRCESASGGSSYNQVQAAVSFWWEELREEEPQLPTMETVHTQTKN